MTTENQIENNQEVVTENLEVQAPEFSEIEQRAMEMGWRPKEEFSGDEVDFVDAKEFVARKPLYDKIGQQSKELKNVRAAVEALSQHYSKVRETEYTRAMRELKDQRKQALVEGDADKFETLDDEIKTVEKQIDVLKAEQNKPVIEDVPTVHPEFAVWQDKNRWYTDTKYMKDFADEYGGRLAGTMPPSEVLKKVEEAVRKEFPQKFVNPNKQNAPAVGASTGTGRGPKPADIEMTEQEAKIMNTLVRTGVLTKEQYIKDLKAAKGIK